MKRGLEARAGAAAVLMALASALAPQTAQAQAQPAAAPPRDEHAFERMVFKDRFEHETQFRAAAIQVAWAAEALCHRTTQIEPFVLLSQHALGTRLPAREAELLRQATGLDARWRIVWLDEDTPDELQIGDAVRAVNGRPLPGSDSRVEFGAWLRGRSMVTYDDQAFWDVMLKARAEAAAHPQRTITVTLDSGRSFTVNTQTGCAGAVTASAFDAEPDAFRRHGTSRVKIPASAMLLARGRDEFRWLAAFGTYFQARDEALEAAQRGAGVGTGFLVGKVLTLAVPGAGMLLTAVEAQAEQSLSVGSVVGRADLFASEVVVAMGGDVEAGLRLTRRLMQRGAQPEAVLMDEFRRSNAVEHARRIRALQRAQAERERAEEEAQARRQAAPAPETAPVRP